MKVEFCMNKYIQIDKYIDNYLYICIDKDRIFYESYPKKANIN